MKQKLQKIKSDIDKVITKLDSQDILGPVAYLEECLENIDAAIEELDLYFGEDDES